jgi:hypothetical protein
LASRREVKVQWGLVDFVVMADSSRGVGLYMAPSLSSEQGDKHASLSYIAFDPIYVRQWVLLAGKDMQKPWPDSKAATLIPMAPAIVATTGRAFLLLARGQTQSGFLLVLKDSISTVGWTALADAERGRVLLGALDEVASLSRYDPSGGISSDSAVHVVDSREVQRAPRLVSMEALWVPSSQEHEGRVWARYVVDSSGRVKPESIEVIFSDGPAYTERLRQALATAVYEPGQVDGVPVRVACFQVFSFRFRRW